jgi:phthalate 3,4-dioxygenase ferredoxin reductase subunit
VTPRDAVVVGASIGGVRVVQALRRKGFEGRIRLVGDEPDPPYDRPPLSKGALAGTQPDAVPLLTAGQARDLGVELHLGTAVTAVEPGRKRVTLADGSTLPCDVAVVATGARARRPPWPVGDGVHLLRTLRDCRALRTGLAAGGPVVVVGAGFVGSEVAATCRSLGLPVTLVDPEPQPMARVVGPDTGRLLADLHRRHGTGTRFGVGVTGVRGRRGDLAVDLTDGTALACAVVVVGIGAEPVDGGIACDGHGRTATPGVYALGDVAAWRDPGTGVARRIEHWTNAVEQAAVVAAAVTGAPGDPHRPSGFVWSDLYDWTLHVAGTPTAGTQVARLVRDGGFLTVTADAAGRVRGGVAVNWPKASVALRRALTRGEAWTAIPDRLAAPAGT